MAEGQMAAMLKFIEDEASKKVAEVNAQATQASQQEKAKILQDMKEKADKEFTAHMKKIETSRAIARSTAVNKARLSMWRSVPSSWTRPWRVWRPSW
jgi:V-type H+-transporting ATPase subunit E